MAMTEKRASQYGVVLKVASNRGFYFEITHAELLQVRGISSVIWSTVNVTTKIFSMKCLNIAIHENIIP